MRFVNAAAGDFGSCYGPKHVEFTVRRHDKGTKTYLPSSQVLIHERMQLVTLLQDRRFRGKNGQSGCKLLQLLGSHPSIRLFLRGTLGL